MSDDKIDYISSGVDVQAGELAVKSIRELVKRSYNANVLGELGSFGGLYRFQQPSMTNPILVASTDGVGTKLRIAIMANVYDTVGQDLVNHCVNDILVQGAEPLFFLDYIGLSKLNPQHVQNIVSGMVQACVENSCALIGGEMAEMPGFYHGDDFDLAGTIIGVVDHQHLLPAERIRKGDILVGFPSSGLHTNGYSLVRKIVFEHLNLTIDSYIPELGNSLGEALLTVHISYLPVLKPFLTSPHLHGLAHITGGGIPGNLKRIIPDGMTACVNYPQSSIPPLFGWLKESGDLSKETMREAFNLGIGMVAVIDSALCSEILAKTPCFLIGEIVASADVTSKVVFC